MSKDNQNLKIRRIQADYQLLKLKSAITLLLGNKAPSRDNWQVLIGKNIAAKQQEVLTRIVTKVGVTKNLANIGRLHNNTDYLLCAADHSKGACLYLPTFNARGAV